MHDPVTNSNNGITMLRVVALTSYKETCQQITGNVNHESILLVLKSVCDMLLISQFSISSVMAGFGMTKTGKI